MGTTEASGTESRTERADFQATADPALNEAADRTADTKVRTAISWLERADLLQRDENVTSVFQARPMVKDLDEARARIAGLNL